MPHTGIKWEKTTQYKPVHNIISSDFPKYSPQPWKYMEGKPMIEWILSYEYQRMWLEEREAWKKRIYAEHTKDKVDVVKRYVLTFKTVHKPPKPTEKKLFKMKKFDGIGSKTTSKRPPDDKAMQALKHTKVGKPEKKETQKIQQVS